MTALTGALHLKIRSSHGPGGIGDVFIGQAESGIPRMRRIAETQRNSIRSSVSSSGLPPTHVTCVPSSNHLPYMIGTEESVQPATIGALVDVARIVNGYDFQPVFFADLFGVRLAILFCRTIRPNLFDLAR